MTTGLKDAPPVVIAPDLRALSRPAGEGASSTPAPALAAQRVPPPRFSWKTRVLLPAALLVTIVAMLAYAAKDTLWPATPVRVAPVVVKSGSEAGATTFVQAPGWVEADPYPITVTALADGIVNEVLALEGQPVKAGDVVVRLVDDDARIALAKAEAELKHRTAQLEAAQAQWDHPVERTRAVATADAAVAETKAELTKLDADVATEQAKANQSKEELARTEQSARSNAASEIELIQVRRGYEAQLAVLDATKARKPILDAQLRQRQADLVAAKDNLKLRIEETQALHEAMANVDLMKAARDEASLRMRRMDVRSPADGVVMNRLAEPGGKLIAGMDDPRSATAVRLYDPKRLQVRVDVPLADAAKVGVGQQATVVVGVLPDRTFNGVVTRVVNEADISKNTLQVKVAITDPVPALKPEMLARVKFAVGSAINGNGPTTRTSGQLLFAPESLIRRDGNVATAWVVDTKRGVAEQRTVTTGETHQDGWVSVTSGLRPGDQLIADTSNLNEGQRVRVTGEADGTESNKEGHHATH
ncbi:MAG: efflux RND transporter periplasmic adaptor subunit [Tepidisphaeraceae bacterium]